MPEELWTEICDIVPAAVIKIIPKEKKCKKAKWLSGEGMASQLNDMNLSKLWVIVKDREAWCAASVGS